MQYIVLLVVIGALAASFFKYGFRLCTVLEYERGLKYVKGQFKGVLQPGQYWHMPFFVQVQKVDIRPQFVSIPGQEVLSADGVTLKVSLAANFEVADPAAATNKVKDYSESLYLELQLALREIVGSAEIDKVLDSRDEFSKKLMEMVAAKAADFGLKLIAVSLKDIMFPGKLKEIFAQVVTARKEGLAALEKARGETAALRSLANAARMLEGNPNLLQLRLLQAVGESSGSTLVLGLPPSAAGVLAVASREGSSDTEKKPGKK